MSKRTEKMEALKAKVKENREKLAKITERPPNGKITKLEERKNELTKRREELMRKQEE
jgi:uncharacterized membrane protein (DUF106 family)